MTASALIAPVRRLPIDRPLRWLSLGWRDLARAPLVSLFHGLVFLLAGSAIATIGWGRNDLLAGAFSGFLLLAPMLCSGLYESSRRMAHGDRATLRGALLVWVRGSVHMARMGVLLAILGSLWVLLSVVIVSTFGPDSAREGGGIGEFMIDFVLAPDPVPFIVWLIAGGVFAAMVFAMTAVSVPLMLDREVRLGAAVVTSVKAVGANPGVMAVWGLFVMLITLAALFTLFPMIVLVPWLGHATWHAYDDAVDVSALPPRV